MHTPVFWIGFHILIATALFVDLKVFHRRVHKVQFREAVLLSAFWIVLALLFNIFVYMTFGPDEGLQFFTGYLIEKSLSVDNLFLFFIVFMHFRIPAQFQHKVLYWGILGALVFRITLILLGITLIQTFHWMFYLLGAFLIATGVRFAFQTKQKSVEGGFLLRYFKKKFPVTEDCGEGEFLIRERGKWKATPLLIALFMIECADILFALDSIPAVFAVTTEPFIVYTSNIFAILGLRSLYIVLAASLQKLRYLKYGLAAILTFAGAKMLLSDLIPISVGVSLGVIICILAVTVFISKKK